MIDLYMIGGIRVYVTLGCRSIVHHYDFKTTSTLDFCRASSCLLGTSWTLGAAPLRVQDPTVVLSWPAWQQLQWWEWAWPPKTRAETLQQAQQEALLPPQVALKGAFRTT